MGSFKERADNNERSEEVRKAYFKHLHGDVTPEQVAAREQEALEKPGSSNPFADVNLNKVAAEVVEANTDAGGNESIVDNSEEFNLLKKELEEMKAREIEKQNSWAAKESEIAQREELAIKLHNDLTSRESLEREKAEFEERSKEHKKEIKDLTLKIEKARQEGDDDTLAELEYQRTLKNAELFSRKEPKQDLDKIIEEKTNKVIEKQRKAADQKSEDKFFADNNDELTKNEALGIIFVQKFNQINSDSQKKGEFLTHEEKLHKALSVARQLLPVSESQKAKVSTIVDAAARQEAEDALKKKQAAAKTAPGASQKQPVRAASVLDMSRKVFGNDWASRKR